MKTKKKFTAPEVVLLEMNEPLMLEGSTEVTVTNVQGEHAAKQNTFTTMPDF